LVILMFAFMNTTYAEECTEEKLKELKQQAENITVDIEFDEKNIELDNFDTSYITIQGLTNGFYIYSKNQKYLYESTDNIDGKIIDTITADENKLYVYNDTCPNEIIREIKLTLKRYNPFSQYSECEGIDSNKLEVCKEYIEKDITYQEFINKINEYKKNNDSKEIKEEIKENNIYLIIGGILVVVIISIILVIRRKRNVLD